MNVNHVEMSTKQTERQRQNTLNNMALGRIRREKRHRQHHRNPMEFGEGKCARILTMILCKIPCVIVCFICGGDTYLLFGYSRLVLEEKIGAFVSTIGLMVFAVCMTLLLVRTQSLSISVFKC